MSTTTIGKDGLTDEERRWLAWRGDRGPTIEARLTAKLAAERLAHAETRAALQMADPVTCEGCSDRLPSHTAYANDEDDVYTCGRCMAGLAEMLRARAEKAEAERDRLRAALEAMRVAGDRLHDDLILYHAAADVIPEWNRARALLGEVKP